MTDKYDKLFGKRIETIRKIRGKTRKQIADKVKVSPQQIQKYERADNRVAVGRLYEIANALNVTVGELIPEELEGKNPIFKGQVSTFALHLWSNLSDSQKQKVIAIMKEMQN